MLTAKPSRQSSGVWQGLTKDGYSLRLTRSVLTQIISKLKQTGLEHLVHSLRSNNKVSLEGAVVRSIAQVVNHATASGTVSSREFGQNLRAFTAIGKTRKYQILTQPIDRKQSAILFVRSRPIQQLQNEFEKEYEGEYEGEYENEYEGEYEGEFEGEYEGEFENEYEGEFEGEYEGEFENEYEGEFEGEYEGEFMSSPQGNRTRRASPQGNQTRRASPQGNRTRRASPQGNRTRRASPQGNQTRTNNHYVPPALRGEALQRSSPASTSRSSSLQQQGRGSHALLQIQRQKLPLHRQGDHETKQRVQRVAERLANSPIDFTGSRVSAHMNKEDRSAGINRVQAKSILRGASPDEISQSGPNTYKIKYGPQDSSKRNIAFKEGRQGIEVFHIGPGGY
jgi:hypothetical protein